MSRRIVVEEPCEHGNYWFCSAFLPRPDARFKKRMCPGGSRTVLEGIPDEWVEAAALLRGALDAWFVGGTTEEGET